MKLVMLRAPTKQTIVKYKGLIAKNDGAYEDVETSTDYWTVWASELLTRGWYDEVELWYQSDVEHKPGKFKHSSGMMERYWQRGYIGAMEEELDVLFVRGDHADYQIVLDKLAGVYKVYYPSGPYYCPGTKHRWDLCFIEDPRQASFVREKTNAPVELFKKSCVDNYFRFRSQKKKWDICFVCCAPIHKRKRLLLLRDTLKKMKDAGDEKSAVVIGLTDNALIKEFDGLKVDFVGWIHRSMIGEMMARCRIGLVLSTAQEDGCPRVIMEFLASGLPLVVSEKACCSTIYLNRTTGMLATDEELPEAISELVAISGLYDVTEFYKTSLSMGASVRHFVEMMKANGGPVK